MVQETLEEVAERILDRNEVTDGDMILSCTFPNTVKSMVEMAKWQQERMYTEEDLLSAFEAGMMFIGEDKGSFREWFEQFKNK